MTNNNHISNKARSRKPKTNGLSDDKYSGNSLSKVALPPKVVQNLDPSTEGSNMRFQGSVPDKSPGIGDLYLKRFVQATMRRDISGVIDDIWSDDSPLSFADKLEAIRKIALWDDFGFDVDSFPLSHFSVCQQAMLTTSHHAYEGDVNTFFIENVESMNYAAKVVVIGVCLNGVKQAKETIERILETSYEWEIISACRRALKSIYRGYYPDELHKADFNIEDRADPKTKMDWDRAHSITIIPLTDEMREEYRNSGESRKNDNKG